MAEEETKAAYVPLTKEQYVEKHHENVLAQAHLAPQHLEGLDISKLTPLSPEVISRQATINIGTIGHVAHGKSTFVRAVSTVNTVKHFKEKIRNITIKLGYANSKLYKCPKCPAPDCFRSYASSKEDAAICPTCQTQMGLLRHVSFVDCPGHDVLMATMLAGAAVMDAALLLIAANKPCPQPQTSEHLAAVEIMQLQHLIILQNKIDIIAKDAKNALNQHKDIKTFVQGTCAEDAPIIPISAQLKCGIDVAVDYMTRIPVPLRDFKSSPQMIVIRSFDVNKPGQEADQLMGGVAGGTILKGVLKVGDEIEIKPGIIRKDPRTGKIKCTSILSHITSLLAENNNLMYAVPGGLIGVGLKVDPFLTRSDHLVGHILGHPNELPEVVYQIDVEYYLLRKLLGVKQEGAAAASSKKPQKISKLKEGETLMVNVGSTNTGARVVGVKSSGVATISFVNPVCASEGEKVALSRRIERNFRLIGWGTIKASNPNKEE